MDERASAKAIVLTLIRFLAKGDTGREDNVRKQIIRKNIVRVVLIIYVIDWKLLQDAFVRMA